MAKIASVLFVCWGNVCRSPAAELMLKRELQRQRLGNARIDSAGVAADADIFRPSFWMRWAALRRGMWLKPSPRMFRRSDCSKYDLIIAMDREVQFSINNIAKDCPANVRLLSEFLPEEWPVDVPDPMERSVAVCDAVLDMLDRACVAIGNQFSRIGPGQSRSGVGESDRILSVDMFENASY